MGMSTPSQTDHPALQALEHHSMSIASMKNSSLNGPTSAVALRAIRDPDEIAKSTARPGKPSAEDRLRGTLNGSPFAFVGRGPATAGFSPRDLSSFGKVFEAPSDGVLSWSKSKTNSAPSSRASSTIRL